MEQENISGKRLWRLQAEWKGRFLPDENFAAQLGRVSPWVYLFHSGGAVTDASAALLFEHSLWSEAVYLWTDLWGEAPGRKRLLVAEILEMVLDHGLDAVYLYDEINGWTFVVTHEDQQRYIFKSQG